MTTFIRAYLACNRCGEMFRDETVPQDETIREALHEARKFGWVRRKVGGRWKDFCPECIPGQEAWS